MTFYGPARNMGEQVVQYLRKDIAYTNGATAVVEIGVLPAGAVVLRGIVAVTTAFNAGTSSVIDVGTSGTTNGFASAIALSTIGNIVFDDMATTTVANITADTRINCTLALTGTAATAGAATVIVEYVPVK